MYFVLSITPITPHTPYLLSHTTPPITPPHPLFVISHHTPYSYYSTTPLIFIYHTPCFVIPPPPLFVPHHAPYLWYMPASQTCCSTQRPVPKQLLGTDNFCRRKSCSFSMHLATVRPNPGLSAVCVRVPACVLGNVQV